MIECEFYDILKKNTNMTDHDIKRHILNAIIFTDDISGFRDYCDVMNFSYDDIMNFPLSDSIAFSLYWNKLDCFQCPNGKKIRVLFLD